MRTPERHDHPRIIANLAVSVDGKIDSADREGGGFSSRLDRDRLDALRALADVLVVGAETIRAEDPPLHIKDPARRRQRQSAGRAEELGVVVVSRTGRVPASARFLRERAASRTLALPADLPDTAVADLAPLVASGQLELMRAGEGEVDLRAVVSRLAQRGCRTILVEGGGELIASFLAADLLDEIRITLCPAILGGRSAPSPAGGEGWPLAQRRKLRLVEHERVGDELFLHYEIERGGVPGFAES